jgi:hypothetical protein
MRIGRRFFGGGVADEFPEFVACGTASLINGSIPYLRPYRLQTVAKVKLYLSEFLPQSCAERNRNRVKRKRGKSLRPSVFSLSK